MLSRPISPLALNTFSYVVSFNQQKISTSKLFRLTTMDAFFIFYSDQGSGIIQIDDHSISVDAHQILFTPCKTTMSIILKATEDWNFKFIFINGPQLLNYYQMYSSPGNDVYTLSDTFHSSNLLNQIIQNCTQSFKEDSIDLIELENSKLIAILLTDLIIQKKRVPTDHKTIPPYILKAKHYLDQNYSEKITLDILAKQTQMNKYQLAHEFKNYFSISPITYLINIRLTKAKDLLINSSQRISSISLDIGFNNTNHFINLFKKQTDLTPLQFRKVYGKQHYHN